jgi:hypothetical protein
VLQGYVIQVALNVIILASALVFLHHLSITLVCLATAASIGIGSSYLTSAFLAGLNKAALKNSDRCVAAEIA